MNMMNWLILKNKLWYKLSEKGGFKDLTKLKTKLIDTFRYWDKFYLLSTGNLNTAKTCSV